MAPTRHLRARIGNGKYTDTFTITSLREVCGGGGVNKEKNQKLDHTVGRPRVDSVNEGKAYRSARRSPPHPPPRPRPGLQGMAE